MTKMNARPLTAAIAVALGLGLSAVPAAAKDDDHGNKGMVRTKLSSFNEVHFSGGSAAALRGAISSRASGSFEASIDDAGQIIHYELNYKDLEGAVTQSHIHFGQPSTVGGIVVWLCQTAGTSAPAAVAAATPLCPPDTSGAPVTGSIVPDQVLAQTLQGIDAGEFEEVVRAIRAGAAYVNVHTALFPPGEIRGPLNAPGHNH